MHIVVHKNPGHWLLSDNKMPQVYVSCEFAKCLVFKIFTMSKVVYALLHNPVKTNGTFWLLVTNRPDIFTILYTLLVV